MRKISVKNCRPGMVLAKPIYNDIGRILIGKDVELTHTMITRLLHLGIDSVFIHDSRTDDIIIEDVLSDKTREQALKTIKHTFQEIYHERIINRPFVKGQLADIFKPVMENIIDELKQNRNAMLMLSNIYVRDLYLYTHSLNVTLYSVTMGIAKGFNKQQLFELGLGALLHDIGKTKIPLSILEKRGPLTEEEFQLIKKHPEYGFQILRKEDGIPLLSAHCAYQHHERIDGSGYPRGVANKDIHTYAKIVAISDVYDAVVSRRVYKEPKLPHEALELLYIGVDQDFEREWVDIFKRTIAIYPVGSSVKLSSGETGIVVDINTKFPARPIVRILENNEKGSLDEPYEVDLSKELSKVIISCTC
ncbi:hypothetical protein BHF71_02055 [Vulcanibacillus modesticaldus]|uniref:HD-GYP domain-containing protein n=1 Tax=Vulcanibacillus modesticaldus TaxID=337097 RepID=A0A1D2YUP2_9BACI|nr:HD-GYP domain-containing protein [Vulcanibacillus modesticaldus]OEF99391.1 hypothetical protein BHF71_02055 [Vulcanibacillus modesticaldus]